MEQQGPNSPKTVTNDSSIGTKDWEYPGNAKVSNDAYASKTLQQNEITYYLKATNFKFGIPPGAKIKGIQVEIERYADILTSIKDYSVKLVKGGTIQGVNKALGAWWPISDAYMSYGGSDDLWGVSWTSEDISSFNFGVAIAAKCHSEDASAPNIDHIRITVFYIPVEQRSTKGYKDPGAAANDSSVGTDAWSNPTNCFVSDDTFASVVLSASEISYYLKATNFGFQIEDDAVIKGIKVQIQKKASVANKIKDYSVKLVKGGTIQGDDKAKTDFWSVYNEYAAYGGISDLWDLSWTPAHINSSNFGVVISAKNADTEDITASIDHICLAVFYGYTTPPISEAFKKLMEQPRSEKVYLVEITPGIEMKQWNSLGSGIYFLPWTEKHINVVPEIGRIEENGVKLKEKLSFENMEADAGSCYLKPAADTVWDDGGTNWDGGDTIWDEWPELYVHTSNDGKANDKTIIVYLKLYFASQPKIFNNQYYFPRVKKEGIPNIGTESKDIFSFETSVGGGSIRLLNGDKFFDKIYRRYLWRNKEVKILIGGEDLLYSDYRVQFVGKVQNSSFSDKEVEFALRDARVDLHRKLPFNKYYVNDYPNMDPDAEGEPIPLIWGDVHNVPSTLIDSTVQKGKYKAADHANTLGDTLYAIDAVYNNGVQIDAGHLSFDLANGEFTILNSYGGNPGTITCDVRGRKDDDEGSITGYSDGMIKKAADVIKDICKNLLGLERLNNDDFDTARIEAPQELAIYLGKDEYSNKVIEKICSSVMGHFVIGANGFIYFSIWSEEVPDDVVELKEEDILSFQESCEIEEIFWKIIVKYDQNPSEDEFKAVYVSDDSVKYKYSRPIEKEIETYLKQTADSENLAANILAKAKEEKGKYEIETKLKAIELKVGDNIKIDRDRGPTIEGKLQSKIFRVLGVNKDISKMRTRLKLMEET